MANTTISKFFALQRRKVIRRMARELTPMRFSSSRSLAAKSDHLTVFLDPVRLDDATCEFTGMIYHTMPAAEEVAEIEFSVTDPDGKPIARGTTGLGGTIQFTAPIDVELSIQFEASGLENSDSLLDSLPQETFDDTPVPEGNVPVTMLETPANYDWVWAPAGGGLADSSEQQCVLQIDAANGRIDFQYPAENDALFPWGVVVICVFQNAADVSDNAIPVATNLIPLFERNGTIVGNIPVRELEGLRSGIECRASVDDALIRQALHVDGVLTRLQAAVDDTHWPTEWKNRISKLLRENEGQE